MFSLIRKEGYVFPLINKRIQLKQRFGILWGAKMKSVDTSIHHYLLPNINEEGWKFVSILALITLIMALIWTPLGLISLGLTVWCFYNYRDPMRVTPVNSGFVIAPTDGKIVAISREKGPDALGLGRKNFTRISIYSSPFDVHINRMPIKSTISQIFYDSGKKCSASFDKNNIHNEKMLILANHSGGLMFVLQLTSLFCSKRIFTRIKRGDEFLSGQKWGYSRFGGYVDILLPEKIEPQVCVGQSMIGGETIIADIKSDAPRMEGEIR